MPVIVFASPKGGAGKSTTAILLACELADNDATVTLMDVDPNKPVARWASLAGVPDGMKIVDDVTERTIIARIEEASRQTAFVIVDVEGAASRMIPYAMSRADLVIIPSQGSALDAVEAIAAVNEVHEQEVAFRIKIPAAVLFTRTSAAIKPKSFKAITSQLAEHGVPVFETQIRERDAYRAIFLYGGTIRTLTADQAPNLLAAQENAEALMREVITRIREGKEKRA